MRKSSFYQKISQKSRWFSHHQVRNHCSDETMGNHLILSLASTQKRLENSMQFLSWNKTPLNDKLRLFFIKALLSFAPTGDRWFHPQSFVSDLLTGLFLLLPFLEAIDRENTLTSLRKKQSASRELDNFLRNTQMISMLLCSLNNDLRCISPFTKANSRIAEERSEREVRFNCW